MATEIERKFLVIGDSYRESPPTYYCQGYLNREKERTVRVRIAGQDARLTVKGVSHGPVRAEFEYEIPMDDAKQLMELCKQPLIEKERRVFVYHGMEWEIDEFMGENRGLVVAEIELESPDQPFQKPDWIGIEVTDDPKYFNSNLSKHPYAKWER